MTVELRPIRTLGFIGLGVMGEAMCGHLARRSSRPVLAHDLRPEPLARLAADGVKAVQPDEIARNCDLVLLSLPTARRSMPWYPTWSRISVRVSAWWIRPRRRWR
jgi:phosphoglycerate dehydrogenase-like enzyme